MGLARMKVATSSRCRPATMLRGQKRCSPLPSSAAVSLDEQRAPKTRKTVAVEDSSQDALINARLQRAAQALKPGVPKGGSLPCREVERERIARHLLHGVTYGGTTQVLYVSGMPGTGKTATVLDVLGQMRRESIHFHLAHVNAMRLGAPVQIFREIVDQLPCESVGNSGARNYVQATDYFSGKKETDPVVVLLIDEVDCLMTSNQAILYKVFDWLSIPKARLVLAAISNTMDLPERLLPRVASRFHIERVDFEPYTKSQLYEILCNRLKSSGAMEAFADVVLRLCAARVATSGDVRKALQICRRAVEICLSTPSRQPGPVKVAELTAAEKELLFANPVAHAVQGLSSPTRHFLAAFVMELRQKDVGEFVLLPQVSARFQKFLAMAAVDGVRGKMKGESIIEDGGDVGETDEMAMHFKRRLEAMAILAKQSSSTGGCFEFQTLSLRSLDVEELATALLKVEDDPSIRELLETGRPDYLTGVQISSGGNFSEGSCNKPAVGDASVIVGNCPDACGEIPGEILDGRRSSHHHKTPAPQIAGAGSEKSSPGSKRPQKPVNVIKKLLKQGFCDGLPGASLSNEPVAGSSPDACGGLGKDNPRARRGSPHDWKTLLPPSAAAGQIFVPLD